MRSNLVRGLAFLAVGSGIFLALRAASLRLDPVFPGERRRDEVLRASRGDIEVLAVGNSHCEAIDFDALGVRGFHLWSVGQDLFETEELLRTHVPRLPRLRAVLLPASYNQFTLDNGIDVVPDRSQHRRNFYALLPHARPIEGDWKNLVAGKLASVVREDHWAGVWEALFPAPEARAPGTRDGRGFVMPDGFIVRKPPALSMTPERQELYARRHASDQVELQRQMLAADPDIVRRTYATFLDVVRFLEERGIRLVLYRTPFLDVYHRTIDPELGDEARRLMARFSAEAGVPIHDFSHDAEVLAHPEWFGDPTHLNRVGAAYFSRERLRPLLEAPGDG